MTNTNITAARSNLFKLAECCIDFNDIVNINTKKGNVVMLSEEEYNGMIETLYLYSVPGLVKTILSEKDKKTGEFEDFTLND